MPNFFPFAGQENNEADWRTMASQFVFTGIIPGIGNNLDVSADGTGMFVRVAAGAAWVQGHYFENTAAATIDIDRVTTSGHQRIDYLVVHCDLFDTGQPRMRFLVVKGVSGTSPATPALTRNANVWQLPIASITVPYFSGTQTAVLTASNVTMRKLYASKGTIAGIERDLPGYNANPNPPLGTVAFNSTTRKLMVHNGSAWQEPTPQDIRPTRYLNSAVYTGELTSNSGAYAWKDGLVLDSRVPLDGCRWLHVSASYEGTLTTTNGGPFTRWVLNGSWVGQQRLTQSPQNTWQATTMVDYLPAPAAGAAFTLRWQFCTGVANNLTKVNFPVGIVQAMG